DAEPRTARAVSRVLKRALRPPQSASPRGSRRRSRPCRSSSGLQRSVSVATWLTNDVRLKPDPRKQDVNVHPYLDALDDSWLGHIMRDVPWLFPTCEGLHFVGMSLLLGTIGVIDLRVLGFFKGLRICPLHLMLPLAFFGFAINVATGVAFVCSDPDSYWIVGAFRLKMVLILLAGANAL